MVRRRARAGKIVDLIDVNSQRMHDVVMQELKIVMIEEMKDPLSISCAKVIDTQNFMPAIDKSIAKETADKAGATRYQGAHQPGPRPGSFERWVRAATMSDATNIETSPTLPTSLYLCVPADCCWNTNDLRRLEIKRIQDKGLAR